ncbi:MAG: class I SAM-dependent methyltransferase [Bacteroidales bacterium]|jgi:23S rRNA (cytosine1962-C5)-methyltransferase|nr:class I SAM-dependent methyltransferase [Bacteroidales bacterium]
MNISPTNWKEYELIDSGNFEKLERFGEYILYRPEPQAIWNKNLSEYEWEKLTNAKFILDVKNCNGEKGYWKKKKEMPDNWEICYDKLNLKFHLSFNTFKHIGIFPEQAVNWDYINECISDSLLEDYNVLNMFAYTGGASLAACKAGAKVVHVDSVKPVVNRANENMKISNLTGISWIIDDALKFAKREVNRNKKYNGIILDPPAFGRGPEGEKWILEKNLNELINLCSKLLKNENSFFILNLYSMGLSPLILNNLVNQYFKEINTEFGEIYFEDKFSKKLPLGSFLRFKK